VATHAGSGQGEPFLDSFGLFAFIVMGTFVFAILAAILGVIMLS
jgi:hypothetical protein